MIADLDASCLGNVLRFKDMGCPEPKVGILMPIPFLNPPHYPIEMARAPVLR